MRLIDADEFQKQIAGMAILNNYPPNKANALCKLVDNQPTAFDVENVVSNLEQLKLDGACEDCGYCECLNECWDGDMSEEHAINMAKEAHKALKDIASLLGFEILVLRDRKTGRVYRWKQ